jgi:signal transduction histidine kinase
MDQRLAAHPQLLSIWRRGEPINNQPVVLQAADGERYVEATLQPLTDHLGAQIGFSLSLVDRTEEKHLQQELTMRERLAALGELAAGIAHEIRNPLNGIELLLGLVQEDLLVKGLLDERFTRIHDEVARLNVILTDFLLFARPKPPEPEPSNLVDLIEDALALVGADLEEKKIEVVRQFDRHVPDTMLDPAAIRRALVNLIKNACQAMDEHGRLWLTVRGPASTDGGFQLEIRDSGPGISDEVKTRLFHPFVTTKGSGTGLGLSIVHKTIISHNGSIHCYNHPTGGACFVVQLPYAEVS